MQYSQSVVSIILCLKINEINFVLQFVFDNPYDKFDYRHFVLKI